jgi:aspartyl-tRNA(Asn)/glutamyl-tRNA(Gln) amidotransferase subunit C
MKIDDSMIEKISRLAYLEFGEEEREKIRKDLEQILTFVEKLNELDTEDVDPLVYLSENKDVLREDKAIRTISTEEALLNAPEKDGRFFKVPKVIHKKQNHGKYPAE